MARFPRIGGATGLVSGLGAVMLVAGSLLAAYAFQSEKQSLPYSYATSKDEPPEAAQALAKTVAGATARTLELRNGDQGKLLATGRVLALPDGEQVLVGWTSAIGEPLLRSDISVEEEDKLVAALRKHLPKGGKVFAMPALSRRLAKLAAADHPLAKADDSATIRLPEPWAGAREAILEAERKWRPSAPDTEADKLFADFIEALAAEDKYGIARLQVMAGGEECYVVLHVRDAFDIGVAKPDLLSVGLRDFPSAGNVHDVTKQVKTWVVEEGHAAYAVIQRDANAVRAYYLADSSDKSSLLGQLLPFNSARIGLLPGATLVFQNGGYWVYRIPAVRSG